MKKNKKISIKDISKELGISTTTISFIINKKAKNRISTEVIKKVEDYIDKIGYMPNPSAQALRTGKTRTIVFMAEDISDPFFSEIAKEMEEIAFENGYKIIYCSTENKKDRALELLALFRNRQVDAFIITPPEDFEEEMRKLIHEENQTVMVFDRYYESFEHHYVVLDNYQSATTATLSLLSGGAKNVAFVGIDSNLSVLKERLKGYQDTIYKKSLNPCVLLLKFQEIKCQTGKDIISAFMKDNPQIEAILFATNNLAISGLRVMKEKAIKIPEDISLISFDERDVFELYSPPISVLSQPVPELAYELIIGTLELLKSQASNTDFIKKTLKGSLVIRNSSPNTIGAIT